VSYQTSARMNNIDARYENFEFYFSGKLKSLHGRNEICHHSGCPVTIHNLLLDSIPSFLLANEEAA
jgi:hypothetical protein